MRVLGIIGGLLLAAHTASAFTRTPVLRDAQARSLVRPVTASEELKSGLPNRAFALHASRDEGDAPTSGPFAKLRQLLPSSVQTALLTLLALSPLSAAMQSAEAVGTGGRMGGSGFRSAPSQTRRYSSPSPSMEYSTPRPSRGYVERVPVPVPVVPFGGFGGFGYSPYPSMGISVYSGINPLDVVILGAIAAGAVSILSNRLGGSRWELDEDSPSSLGDGVSVLKLQVGLQVSDRSSADSILGQLDQLAKTADVSTREGLARLVSSTCLCLLRSSVDWVAAAGETKHYGRGSNKAEGEYQRLAIRERSKFDREEDVMERRTLSQTMRASSPYMIDGRPTMAVVTLCVALRGNSIKFQQLSSAGRLREALQQLGADALTDDGENVLATEVLWTPQDDSDVLTKQDLYTDYPELIDI